MKELFCESCGMPLDNDSIVGTNADQTKNKDYCIYCYANGNFTGDVTMNEMIDISLKHMKEIYKDDSSFDEQKALEHMKSFFPKLKRWKQT